MKCLVNLNGEILPIGEAKISVMDHGFLYGDSVFETFRTYYGYPFLLRNHLDRLFQSAAGLHLKPFMSKNNIAAEVLRTAVTFWKRYSMCDLYIRVILSRGFGDIGFDPSLCPRPTQIIIVKKFTPLSKLTYERGVSLALVSTLRNHPKAIDPNIKSGNYLNNILAYMEAKKQRAFDALMQNNHGYLAEGTTCNVFLVSNEVLYTPSVECGLLKGLTRSLVLDIAKNHGIKSKTTKIKTKHLFLAEECFVSSSLKGILPVSHCNSRQIGTGKPGPVTRKLMYLFENAVKHSIEEEYCIAL